MGQRCPKLQLCQYGQKNLKTIKGSKKNYTIKFLTTKKVVF